MLASKYLVYQQAAMHLRYSLPLSLLVLVGCSSAPSWRRLQSDRLEKLHSVRDFTAAIGGLRNHQPRKAQGQDPEPKIDQRAPAAVGSGPRRYRGSGKTVRVFAKAGLGSVQFVAPGTTLSDRTAGSFLRLGFDGNAGTPIGPSLHISGFTTDDELFRGSLTNSGQAFTNADARALSVRAFPHARFPVLKNTAWVMPARLGIGVSHTEVSHRGGVTRKWLTVGPRFELEPRMALWGTPKNGFDLIGSLSAEVGYGAFSEDFRGGDDRDDVAQVACGAGLGLRWHRTGWWFDIGFDWGQSRMIGTDTTLFGDRTVRMETQNIYIGGSISF